MARRDCTTLTVTAREVTTLKHEARDNTVELRASVSETVLAGCQLAEVLRGSGDGLIEEFKCYTSGGFRVHSNVKLKWWFSGALNQSIKQHIAHTKTLECEDFGL